MFTQVTAYRFHSRRTPDLVLLSECQDSSNTCYVIVGYSPGGLGFVSIGSNCRGSVVWWRLAACGWMWTASSHTQSPLLTCRTAVDGKRSPAPLPLCLPRLGSEVLQRAGGSPRQLTETSSMTHLDKTWDFDSKPHRGAAPGAIEVTVSLGMKVWKSLSFHWSSDGAGLPRGLLTLCSPSSPLQGWAFQTTLHPPTTPPKRSPCLGRHCAWRGRGEWRTNLRVWDPKTTQQLSPGS